MWFAFWAQPSMQKLLATTLWKRQGQCRKLEGIRIAPSQTIGLGGLNAPHRMKICPGPAFFPQSCCQKFLHGAVGQKRRPHLLVLAGPWLAQGRPYQSIPHDISQPSVSQLSAISQPAVGQQSAISHFLMTSVSHQ